MVCVMKANNVPATLSFSVFVLLLANAPTALAENTNRSTAEPVCQRDDVILCENWEDGDHVGWDDWQPISRTGVNWGGMSCSPGSCDFPYPGYQSTYAALLHLSENDPDTMWAYGKFNTPVGADDTLYLRWYAYFSPNFEWNTTNTKNIYLVPASGAGVWEVPFFFRPQEGPITQGMPYFHFYCGLIEVVPGSDVDRICAESGGDMRYFPNQPGYENFRIDSGRWYSVEFMVKPNPSGSPFGGHISAWIDGNKVIDYDNVSVRHTNVTEPLYMVWIASYFGGGGSPIHPDEYVLYDDIVVSKSYIGPNGVAPITDAGTDASVPTFDAGSHSDAGSTSDAGRLPDAGLGADGASTGGPVTDASSKPPVNPLAPAEPASDEGNGCSMARSASRGHAPFYAITTLALFLLRRYRRRSVAGLSRSETTLSTSNRIRKHPSAVPTNEVLRASRS